MIYQPRNCSGCDYGVITASEVAAGREKCQRCLDAEIAKQAEQKRNAGLWRANEKVAR